MSKSTGDKSKIVKIPLLPSASTHYISNACLSGIFDGEDAELLDFNQVACDASKKLKITSICIPKKLPFIFINKARARLLFSSLFKACTYTKSGKIHLTCSITSNSWKFTISSYRNNTRHKRTNKIPDNLKTAQDIVSFYEGKFWLLMVNKDIIGVSFSLPIYK